MRDKDGTYAGHHLCSHYGGVHEYRMVECCGGRMVRRATVRCELKGIIAAEPHCSSSGCDAYRAERGAATRMRQGG